MGVVLGGWRGSVAVRLRAATFSSVPTPSQSALSRALLQPSAGAAASAARAAGPAPGDQVREGGRPGWYDESRTSRVTGFGLWTREGTRPLERTQSPSGDGLDWRLLILFPAPL